MAYETILLERRSPIAYLTLNRPERANTISAQLAHEMLAAIEEIEADRETRVLIVTGAGGRHFCGGADLRDPVVNGRERGPYPLGEFIRAFETSRVPVIAAINGAAMGGGCEIALGCDLRVMAESATIGLPEIRFGALPTGGGTQRLPRVVGPAVAKEMILTGLPLTAGEAYRVGLVNRVVPAAQLMTACEQLAAVLAERAGFALKTGKALVNLAIETPLEEGLALERKKIREMATPEERGEAQQRAAATQATYARIFDRKS
jgi:enoyl-CoA hydratase/carnithine racemase